MSVLWQHIKVELGLDTKRPSAACRWRRGGSATRVLPPAAARVDAGREADARGAHALLTGLGDATRPAS